MFIMFFLYRFNLVCLYGNCLYMMFLFVEVDMNFLIDDILFSLGFGLFFYCVYFVFKKRVRGIGSIVKFMFLCFMIVWCSY